MVNVTPLRKILELELQKGCPDRAVIGGLDRFLARWSGPALTEITPGLLKRFKELGLAGARYASLTPEERKAWATQVLRFLSELEGGKLPEKTAATVKAPPAKPVTVKKSSPRPVKKTPAVSVSLEQPITVVKGISTAIAPKLQKLGVGTIRDLLYFFPHRHLDYSQVKTISQLGEGAEQTVVVTVWEARQKLLGGRPGTEATIGDETGNMQAVWFNQPYLARRFRPNTRLVLSGRVSYFRGRPVFEAPDWEVVESDDTELLHTGRLVPVYHLTQGLYPRQVRKIVKGALDRYLGELGDFLPPEVRTRQNLLELSQAIYKAHFPESEAAKGQARVRLAFDELFLLQLGVLSKKRDWQASQPGIPFKTNTPILERFLSSLPFKLTAAQQKVLGEIRADLERKEAMSRLLQGEVGSGKTVVALAALLVATANGYQGALMAPTELLAEQHFNTICGLLSKIAPPEGEGYLRRFTGILSHPLGLALLMGDTTSAEKKGLQQALKKGEIDLAIGTHALIQKGVSFPKLGLVVVDEQHRFGVTQRAALRQKGFNPHVLVMTATPIPRTLSLTLYGDLDLSVISELPPERQVIKTRWLRPEEREKAYNFVRRQVAEGHQAFIICPLVEESEAIEARAATVEYERLSRQVFPDLHLGLLHGRMSAREKDEVMRRFRAGELNILVSTPVVEVGIDVPNATVMLVESADRFGLAQLHQFRGRVGRGTAPSYCILVADNPSEVARLRLDIIEKTQDGFKLAEEDLRLRGPGEFFGTRQSGLPDLRMAKLSDVALLEQARREATRLFEADRFLKSPPHQLLAQELSRVWQHKPDTEWS